MRRPTDPSAALRLLPLVLLLFVARTARAAEAAPGSALSEAKQHFQKGQTHYALGEFALAADEFREAYRLKSEPAILFNLGQSMRLLGHYKQAAFYYSQYLLKRPDAGNRPEVEALLASIRKNVEDEDAAERRALLEPPAPAAPGTAGSPTLAPPLVVAAARPDEPRRAPATATSSGAPRPSRGFATPAHLTGIGLAGGGALSLGLAVLFHASAQSAADQIDQKRAAGTLSPADQGLNDQVKSKGRLGTVAAVGGVLLLASGGLLTFGF